MNLRRELLQEKLRFLGELRGLESAMLSVSNEDLGCAPQPSTAEQQSRRARETRWREMATMAGGVFPALASAPELSWPCPTAHDFSSLWSSTRGCCVSILTGCSEVDRCWRLTEASATRSRAPSAFARAREPADERTSSVAGTVVARTKPCLNHSRYFLFHPGPDGGRPQRCPIRAPLR